MNCQEFWDQLPQGGLDITEAQAGHLAECAACHTQWRPYRAVTAGLRSLAEEWRKTEAPPRVEAGLMAAFRMQSGSQVRRALERSWTPVLAWVSAAAATVAIAALLIHGYQPPPANPGTVAAPRHTAQPVVQMASSAAPDTDSDDDAAVLGEGFVRLPNAPRIEPDEDFNVVRVEVPGSAMIAMGVSMSEDRATENVVADVALASDGTARAVRLVSDGGTY